MRREPLLTLEAKASLFDHIILWERVDPLLLDQLIAEGSGWLLPRYKKAVVDGRVPVEYRKKQYGRAIVTGSVGLHNMERPVRHRLARGHYTDWDMKNAHPTILLQICQAHRVGCQVLRSYVEERETVLDQVVAHYGVGRQAAKDLFLRLIFGGGFEGWLKEQRVPPGKSGMTPAIRGFSQEMTRIARLVTAKNPSVAAYVKAAQQKQRDNFDACVLATFLQETECRILESLFRFCVEGGLIRDSVAVLCNDGFMLEQQLSRPDLAQEFQRLIFQEHGFLLEFVTKSMEPTTEVMHVEPTVQGDLYRHYLRHLYPAQSIWRMLSMVGVPGPGTRYRRLAMVAKSGAYWRDPEEKVVDQESFERELLSHQVAQLHFDELRLREGTSTVSLRELVFDVDATGFERFCGCGKEKRVCSLCWLHVEGAALLLHHLLTARLGIPETSLLWVLSGLKGFHCVVNERRLLLLTTAQRKALLGLLCRSGPSELSEFAASLDPDFALLLHSRFESLCVVGRRLLECQAFLDQCLTLLVTHYPDLHSVMKEAWASPGSSQDRWATLKALQRHSRQPVDATLVIILQCYFPVIDEGPMRSGSHVFKVPFSIHSQSRRVSLPVPLERLTHPVPGWEAPSLEALCGHRDGVHPEFVAAHELFLAWLPDGHT